MFPMELVPALGGLLTVAFLHLALDSRLARWLVDEANERSLHAGRVPRIGGVAMAVGLIPWAAVAVMQAASWMVLASVVAYGVLAVLSMVDDAVQLTPKLRFLAHVTIALAWLMAWILASDLSLWWCLPCLIGLTWATNLYNFMDGADGLAASMAIFGFGAYALAAGLAGDAALAGWAASLVAVAAGFLWFNWPPAKVFMGDSGSIPLGFSAGALGLLGVSSGLWSPAFALLSFAPFGYDATVTLIARRRRGMRWSQAHREHIYQRYILAGARHLDLLLRFVVLQVLCMALAWSVRSAETSWLAQCLACGLGLVLLASVQRAVLRRARARA